MHVFLLLFALANPLDKLSDEDLAAYRTKTGQEAAFRAGERLLADLEKRDPYVAAALVDAATVRFHDQEARRFAKDRQAVIIAYGILWAVTVIFAVWLWRRQVRINDELGALVAKLEKRA
jgi:hypothetical protein